MWRISLFLLACSSAPPSLMLGAECTTTAQCSNALCIQGRCTKPECFANDECAAGQVCGGDYLCRGVGSTVPLVLTAVSGDGPALSALVVTGEGFDDSTAAQLVSADLLTTHELTVAVASTQSFTGALPLTVTPGTFTLRVTTATSGSATRQVSLFKGDKGDTGPMGAPGTVTLPITTAGYNDNSVAAITASNTSSTGTALLASAPNGGTAISVNAAADGAALLVLNGQVELGTAVRLPIRVKEFAAVGAQLIYAYCDVGEVMLAGSCMAEDTVAAEAAINISKMQRCNRPNPTSGTFTSSPGGCSDITGAITPTPATDPGVNQSYWLCRSLGVADTLRAQVTCLRATP